MTAQMLQEIFFTCVIPLIGILCAYGIAFVRKYITELNAEVNNALFEKYSNMLIDIVEMCVIATNQTYVDSLKAQGKFDKEAQKEAFNRTYSAVMNILADDAKAYLTSAVGDLNTYITNMIETQVKENKIPEE